MTVLTLFSIGVSTVSASVDIDGVKVKLPSSIKAGESFDVEVTIEGPTEAMTDKNIDIEITADEVIVHQESRKITLVEDQDYQFNLSSNDFITEDYGRVWEKNLMSYGCKEDIEFQVSISDNVDGEASDTMTIKPGSGKELYSKTSPETFALDGKFIVTVYDEDDDTINSAKVKLTWVDDKSGIDSGEWDVDDKSTSDNTNSDGETEFKLSTDISKTGFGKYQQDIYKDLYCKETKTFSIFNLINISDPVPANPKVGESFKVAVTTPSGNAATGLIVTLNPGNIKSKVLMDGTASFTVNAPGTYSLAVGGGTTGYEEVISSFKVSTKSQLTIAVNPDPVSLGTPVTITVKSDGSPLSDTTVKVTPPGGSEQTLGNTKGDGTINYNPSSSGDYTIRALKTNYDEVSDTFTVKNSFKLDITPQSGLKKGTSVTVVVRDQAGTAVSGATVSLTGTSTSGLTDSVGKFVFTLDDVGTLNLVVRKTGFPDATATLSSSGQIMAKVSSKEITLDESTKISVVDADGKPIDATIKVTGPGGTETQTGTEYTATPKRAGDYSVDVIKTGYAPASESFKVRPKALTLAYSFKDNQLVINVTGAGKPQAGVQVSVKVGNNTLTANTDAAGAATVAADQTGEYVVSINSNDYTASPVTAVKSAATVLSDLWVPVLIALVLIVLIGIFAVVAISLMQRRGGGKPAFKRSAGSRLGK